MVEDNERMLRCCVHALVVLGACIASGLAHASPPQVPPFAITYGDATWNALVEDSYRAVGVVKPDFRHWLEVSWKRNSRRLLSDWIIAKQRDRLTKSRAQRPTWELEVGVEVHRILRKVSPKFNLNRGYEFAHLAARGERQCLLQSVLLGAILNKVGIPSGVAMVWQSPHGSESNLGHATTMAILSDGRRTIVDASENQAYLAPKGIYCGTGSTGQPKFLTIRQRLSGSISEARDANGASVSPLWPLSTEFVRSQFLFYRAERMPSGLLAAKATSEALAKSEAIMRKALAICPRNPLARYTLGRILVRQGKSDEAKSQVEQAYLMYHSGGWVPPGVTNLRASLSKKTSTLVFAPQSGVYNAALVRHAELPN